MWFLKRLSGKEIHYLLVGKQYAIGRKSADILILNDPSISRRHSVINLSHPDANLNNVGRWPVLTLKDSGSKYGTYVNDKKIDDEAVILKTGDKVTFGQCDASFQVCYEPLVITTSCIEKEEKQQLKTLVQRLGGHFLPEWTKHCTHLVMKELKVTIKAVCAMVSLKPLVMKEYFEKLIISIEENKNLPDPERYIPFLGEPILGRDTTSFHIKKERQTLFQNKTFICTSLKQYKKLELAITLAAGKVLLLDSQNEVKNLILHPDTCVMKDQSDSSQACLSLPYYVAAVEEELKKNKKRPIPESDIGLAVVYCSTQHYCNPDYNMASSLFGTSKLHSQSISQQDIYVEDTQASTAKSTVDRNKSKYGSYVLDTFERSKQELSLKSGHQNEVQNPSEAVSQHSLKRERHCSEPIEPENPTKVAKLQVVVIKEEGDGDMWKDRHTEDTQEVRIKTEAVTLIPDRSSVIGCWNESPLAFPDQLPTDAQISVVKEEKYSRPAPPVESVAENVLNKIGEMSSCLTEENVMLPPTLDGFLSKSFHCLAKPANSPTREEQVIDKELPSKVVKIEFASLCQRRNIQSRQTTGGQGNTHNAVRNFKKFRKIYSTGNRLPVIIGGRDLVVYNKNASRKVNNLLNENIDSQSQESEEIGLFDWDSNKRSR